MLPGHAVLSGKVKARLAVRNVFQDKSFRVTGSRRQLTAGENGSDILGASFSHADIDQGPDEQTRHIVQKIGGADPDRHRSLRLLDLELIDRLDR